MKIKLIMMLFLVGTISACVSNDSQKETCWEENTNTAPPTSGKSIVVLQPGICK